MKIVRQISIAGSIALVVLSVSYFTSLFAQDEPPLPPQATSLEPEEVRPIPDDAMEVQTRGPIHEGFATPLTTEVPESIKVRERPPEPIEEVPPEVKPEGSNVVWMPGYWAWNDEDEKFLWISGFWRDVPPGRVWVSGYWTEADHEHQWVPGFWSDGQKAEVTYLPQPPETIEEGPSVEAPSQDHFWVPGVWQWQENRYAWRTGYWSRRTQPNWIWIPAHYVWCPSGYIFVDGYYDHDIEQRGTLFAPVYFNQVVWNRPYYYTPTIAWSAHVLTNHFWVRPHYHHYYYGDYYADRYTNWGIRPWHLSFTFGRVSYDPIYSYHRWRHHHGHHHHHDDHEHHDRDWDRQVRERYDYYRNNEGFRPPRTYRDQVQFANRIDNRNVIRDSVIAAPVTQIVNNNIDITNNSAINNIVRENFRNSNRFTQLDRTQRRQAARQADQIRNVVQERRQTETRDNLAQVDRAEREPGKKGEDTRVRRAAPRSLNVTNLTQAMQVPANVNRRGPARDLPNAKGPDLGVDAARGAKGRDLTDVQKGRRVSDAIRDSAKSRGLNSVDDAGNGRGPRDIAREPGDAVKRPDLGSPNAKGRDIVGSERSRDGSGNAARDAARARDAGTPPGNRRPPARDLDNVPADRGGTLPSVGSDTGPNTALPDNSGRRRDRERTERSVRPGIDRPETDRDDRRGAPRGQLDPNPLVPGGAAVPPAVGDRSAQDREDGRRAAREMIEGRRTDTMPDYPRVGRENIPGATEKGVPRAVGDPSSATRQAREPGPTSQGARSPARTERANPNQITAPGPELPRAAVGGGPGSLTRQPSSPQAPRQIRPTAPPTTPRATESRPRVETPQPRAAPRVERPAPAAPSVREARPIPPGAVERGSGARARARSEEERNKGK